MKCLYNNSRCAVRTEGELGEWFQIVTGVRQGCILSPLIFLLVIDWVMKKATCDTASGIEWLTDSKLKDLDFADDIALLDVSLNGIQDLTSQVEDAAKLVDLRVNAGKTKMMTLGTLPHGNITVSGSTVETVNEFCYLGGIIHRGIADGQVGPVLTGPT